MAVRFSSSSSVASDADDRAAGLRMLSSGNPSFEDVMTLSDSLSLSSYSSWLLVPPILGALLVMFKWVGAVGRNRRLRRAFESCCTRRPVVTISSAIEESEEEDGWEEISIQESTVKLSARLCLLR